MKSLRFKLIVVVVSIMVISLVAVVLSNLHIVRQDKEATVTTYNRQVSSLVSQSIITQISGYRSDLRYLLEAKMQTEDFRINAGSNPDYLWLQFVDWQGQSVFEWQDDQKLNKHNLSVQRLLGKANQSSLFQEVKQILSQKNEWILFNSTVDPFVPTFLFASAFDIEGESFVVLAEVWAEPLYEKVNARAGQELILIDSHQNVLYSTKPGWDPSRIVFKDEQAMEVLRELDPNNAVSHLMEYKDRESQLSYFYKFDEGQGLSLILQEPESNLLAGHRRIQMRAALIGLVVLLISVNLMVLFAGRVIAPLKRLADLMGKVGRGEFSGRIKSKSKDEIGQLTRGFNKMLLDLSDREQEVERAKMKLIQSEKMSAFGQMSAGIAHEVKNPLAGILGYAQMAKQRLEDRPDITGYLETIEKETVRCKEIVENLMRFARQEKAKLSKIDINKTVRDSVRLVEHQISVSGIKIVQLYALEGAPVLIEGSANQIQQVMLNLMLNAQHAMESKGTLTISTHTDDKNQRVMVVVSDTGAGMDGETKRRVFEPFFTTKGVGKGTGLGLSVSIGIIKDHKGTIDLESEPGKGTTFTINFPLLKEQSTKKKKKAAASGEPAEPAVEEAAQTEEPPKKSSKPEGEPSA